MLRLKTGDGYPKYLRYAEYSSEYYPDRWVARSHLDVVPPLTIKNVSITCECLCQLFMSTHEYICRL